VLAVDGDAELIGYPIFGGVFRATPGARREWYTHLSGLEKTPLFSSF
jgi:hypothetical protein